MYWTIPHERRLSKFEAKQNMKIIPFQKLACPLDGEALENKTLENEDLENKGTAWLCPNGHSFDVASKGYTNLLPVQHKRSLDPGDHKAMVAARQRFLNAGFYQAVADAVNQAVFSTCARTDILNCLDAGCGEGYYLRELAAASNNDPVFSGFELSVLGLDISKWAVLAAAKQDARPTLIVGSNVNIPALPNTFDCVLCMFGFPVYAEFARVLKPGGVYIQVDTGPKHLRELRDIIYPSLKEERADKTESPEGFSKVSNDPVEFSIALNNNSQIADLLAMTPHFYRASAEGRDKALALKELSLTVDVQISTFISDMSE